MWFLDDPKTMNIIKNIYEMMTLDAEPFALVERKGFQRLIKYLAPQYPLVEHIFLKKLCHVCMKI
ncbi:zinc finger BED domain-containing protein 4-like [Pogonomyrmex barbatus]|uniref:Zinc finger BED domain-containing protein 4-like n=1 Tax=Pogonomyrmex barbatus TaxID=144034 RepID=A0A6I9VVR8_9HYME|nr:zinc finger BED domain-containing protein 4-like [Pogonomyrmex barbatus]